MCKLVIFDLDGVLLDSRELHFHSLNRALEGHNIRPIDREEHLSAFDGLPTSKKLSLLTEKYRLPTELHSSIWDAKQKATLRIVDELEEDRQLIEILKTLKERGYLIACASNSVRETVKTVLLRLGLMPYISMYVSNEDVRKPKPYPEMYWQAMTALGALPKNTVIVEDSHIGRRAALDSGAHLVAVENRADVDMSIITRIEEMLPDVAPKVPWRDQKLNVLIPMSGMGSRFAQAGYSFPKPLIEIRGKPMIQVVVENLNIDAHYIFICQTEHYEKYQLRYLLNLIAPNCDIVLTDGLTEGAACSTLLARDLINNDDPLLIANSDQFLEWDSNEHLYAFSADGVDAGVVTFGPASHPKWSFAKVGADGFIDEIAEKKVISNIATAGVYWFKKGSDYVAAADEMIAADDRVNGEFYVAPSINYMIAKGKKVRPKGVERMWGVGTPQDLDEFLRGYRGRV